MARRTEKLEIGEGDSLIEINSEALGFEPSEDLLPDIARIVGSTLNALTPMLESGKVSMGDDVMRLAPALGALAAELDGGRLKALAPRVLAGTSVLMKIGGGERLKYDLVKKTDRAMVFDAHPELYFISLWHAGKVTFGPFFRVRGIVPVAKSPPTDE